MSFAIDFGDIDAANFPGSTRPSTIFLVGTNPNSKLSSAMSAAVHMKVFSGRGDHAYAWLRFVREIAMRESSVAIEKSHCSGKINLC